MADFSDKGNSGCFSNMLRRISCFRSLPTHPADHILEPKAVESENRKENPEAATNPGIVARLMGLESLPANNWVSRKEIPDSVVRSRSVNFADYLLGFDLSTQAQQHRRVRTSVSFREAPTLSNQQNHDFLVVCLNGVDESTKGMRSRVRKSEMGFGEMKQSKEQRSKNRENRREKEVVKKENQGNNKISKLRDEPRRRRVSTKKNERRNVLTGSKTKSPLKPINQKKLFVEPKFTGKRKIKPVAVKEKPECDSQNASPVSVLDINDLSEPSRSMKLNLSRKSSGRASCTDDIRGGAIKNEDCELMDISETQYCKEVVGNLYRLTENDIKESNWIAKNLLGFEGFEEVCMEFEQQVLNVLLNQVVDEFVEIPEKSQWLLK